jgi:hypothetical protein
LVHVDTQNFIAGTSSWRRVASFPPSSLAGLARLRLAVRAAVLVAGVLLALGVLVGTARADTLTVSPADGADVPLVVGTQIDVVVTASETYGYPDLCYDGYSLVQITLSGGGAVILPSSAYTGSGTSASRKIWCGNDSVSTTFTLEAVTRETTTVTIALSGYYESTSQSFTITPDITAPVVDPASLPGVNGLLIVEAAGSTTTVTWDAVTATDTVDGTIVADCTPASGTGFALGDTTVTCTATDDADNESAPVSFIVRVVDTTDPTLTLPGNLTREATSASGASVTYTATASDAADGTITPTCTPASGSLFPRGITTVTCTATDTAGNTATGTFTVRVVDTTGPVITLIGGPQPNVTYTQWSVPAIPVCDTSDSASVVTQCTISGYSTAVGRHTMTVRARDTAGNATVVTRSYTVVAGGTVPTSTPTRVPTGTATTTPVVTPTTPVITPTTPVVTPTTPVVTPTTPVVTPTTPVTTTPAPTRPPRR